MAFQAVLDFEFCTQQALSILHLQKRRYMTYVASLFPVLSDDIFATPLPYQWQDNSQFSLHCPVAFALSCNLFSIPGDIFLSPTVYNTTAISPLPAQTSLPRRSSTTSIPMPPHHLTVRCTCLLLHRQAQTGRKPLSLWQALHILSIHPITQFLLPLRWFQRYFCTSYLQFRLPCRLVLLAGYTYCPNSNNFLRLEVFVQMPLTIRKQTIMLCPNEEFEILCFT